MENLPFFGNCISQEVQYGVSELLLSGIGAVVGEMGLQNVPETLNRVQVRATGSDGSGISDVRAIF